MMSLRARGSVEALARRGDMKSHFPPGIAAVVITVAIRDAHIGSTTIESVGAAAQR
jgi:hypothetical protein